ncbi:MAG: ABC transporter permease subunit, partial [Clostridia bacterium]|nr:ABC transporter permease subunit [Clostridia bacterium]
MGAIYKREMKAYFTTPLGFVFSAIFVAVSGILFYYNTFHQQLSATSPINLGEYFMAVMFLMMILIPLLTMKTFADEKKSGTEQLLLTSPVSIGSIVAAKFCAAYTVFGGTFLITCLNLIAIGRYGTPNGGVMLGYIIGILLVGAAFIAVG